MCPWPPTRAAGLHRAGQRWCPFTVCSIKMLEAVSCMAWWSARGQTRCREAFSRAAARCGKQQIAEEPVVKLDARWFGCLSPESPDFNEFQRGQNQKYDGTYPKDRGQPTLHDEG